MTPSRVARADRPRQTGTTPREVQPELGNTGLGQLEQPRTTEPTSPERATQGPKSQARWLGEQAYDAWQSGQAALASGHLGEARRWLERACRLAPADVTAKLALGVVLLRAGDPQAAGLFDAITRAHDVREAWLGLAAAHAASSDWRAASAALAQVFSGHVLPASADIEHLARRISASLATRSAGGWCCVRAGGRLEARVVSPHRRGLEAWLDGTPLAGCPEQVPQTGGLLSLADHGVPLLGSPINLARMRMVEGFVELGPKTLSGWAWHPADPDTDPVLTVRHGRSGPVRRIVATDTGMVADRPMARPRRFEIPLASLAGGPAATHEPIHVCGSDLRDLAGSPLVPGLETAVATAVTRALARILARGDGQAEPLDPRLIPLPADVAGAPAEAPCDPGRPLAVVVPVYRDQALTLACLASVRATMPAGTRVVVVDDATPEPALASALDELASGGAILLLRHAVNRGFPASVNAGLREAVVLPGAPDVILLNSDALLTAGALQSLRTLVHAAPDIGTATPLSNDATILSYPDPAGGNPMLDGPALAALARLAARTNAGVVIDIPTAVGFCMYIRRECLDGVGPFREDMFAQGYGEENDFCIRARHLGWRHVAAPGVYVGHVGGQSFGAVRTALVARNLAVLERLHPGYRALIDAHQRADPLAAARRLLDMARWSAGRGRGKACRSAILVTHDSGGGVERVVRQRCETLRAEGLRPVVLRPVRNPHASAHDRLYHPSLCEVAEGTARAYRNLRFAVPCELDALAGLLRGDRPAFIEAHHLLGHDHAVLSLAGRLNVPWDVHVHDYAWLCPRITLLGADRRYCGEPAPAVCEACIADAGRQDEQEISVAALRARSAVDLAEARQVIAPSRDAATRIGRHFPGVNARVSPLEDDDFGPVRAEGSRRGPSRAVRRICVVGGIGPEKGFDILLACARDAAARGLPLEFVVVGHTVDDARLLATGRVFVTGPYEEQLAQSEIRAQGADLAFLPSIWPETWCYTLGHSWRAGLPVVAFDIGAPAERIRKHGHGTLLPLGLPPTSINNMLLALRPVAGDECALRVEPPSSIRP